ncbi:hypothetical protein HB662_10265 [Roseomonas frigidaquae]|uniref:Uncharacterized protein n=1 Tax=Falsiroseomonas frigidaquae TaxID=487318 RepID=A0ABX1EYN4_9PROT|nr:hypothetical protein [Falsiroseomonas frigidaquae]NKE45163.1 hypothetical protein [Falsiroseomonas frigidaquae]
MNPFNRIATALLAAGALSFAVPALANDVSYPRVVGTGENASVVYAPTDTQNTVGGGAVATFEASGNDVQLRHLEPRFAQAPRPGLQPVTVGSGENVETAWVPAGSAPATGLAGGFDVTGG